MVSEIDLDAPLTVVEEEMESESNLNPTASPKRVDGPHPDFTPMRRKLHMPIPDGGE